MRFNTGVDEFARHYGLKIVGSLYENIAKSMIEAEAEEPVNEFVKYTTGEFLKYPQIWEPVY
jgi:hypothetical protein